MGGRSKDWHPARQKKPVQALQAVTLHVLRRSFPRPCGLPAGVGAWVRPEGGPSGLQQFRRPFCKIGEDDLRAGPFDAGQAFQRSTF